MGFTAKGTPKTHYWMMYQYPMCVQCFPVVWDWSNLKMASRLYIQLIFHFSPSVEMYVFWRVMGCDVLPVSLVKAVNVALCQVKEMSVRENNTFSFKVSKAKMTSPALLSKLNKSWSNGYCYSKRRVWQSKSGNTLIACTSFSTVFLILFEAVLTQCKLWIKETHWMYK